MLGCLNATVCLVRVAGDGILIKSLPVVTAFSHFDDSCWEVLSDQCHFGIASSGILFNGCLDGS